MADQTITLDLLIIIQSNRQGAIVGFTVHPYSAVLMQFNLIKPLKSQLKR